MSAICTHPDFNGRGYARRLTAMLTNDTLQRGRTPYLHVSHENLRAIQLYQHLGYRLRRDIPFSALQRAGNGRQGFVAGETRGTARSARCNGGIADLHFREGAGHREGRSGG